MPRVRRKPTSAIHRASVGKDARAKSLNAGKHVSLVCFLLVVATFAAYSPVLRNGFINYDDDVYVTRNTHVKAGLTMESLGWTFNVGHAGNWHPLTWMSHMLDYRLFGDNAGGHHATSLILHLAGTLLLFLVLRRMIGSSWKSAFAAGLFALHPLHVESVAWVAERKDVLSGFFWMLVMGAYVLYSERPSIGRYLAVILLFGLGMMAKPMLISLPIILLLLDYWPLRRTEKLGLPRLLLEKTPLLAMSAASGIITFVAQHKEGAVRSLEDFPAGVRLANALVAYVCYMGKTVLPTNLAVYYPHPGPSLPVWQVIGSAALLAAVTFGAIYFGRKRRYLAVGWLWYIITLLPVIGLVQVGRQAMADRYSYIPLIGLFIIASMGIAELVGAEGKRKERAMALPAIGVAIIVPLTLLTCRQVGYWRDSVTLFEHAANAVKGNYLAHIQLGLALEDEGRREEAIAHYRRSLEMKPRNDLAHFSLGGALLDQGDLDSAADEFRRAININPEYALAHYNLGLVFALKGYPDSAKREYERALDINPDMAPAHNNLGAILSGQGKAKEAIVHFNKALEIEPNHAMAHFNLGRLFYDQGRVKQAVDEYRKSIGSNPKYPNAYYSLGMALEKQGKSDEAAAEYRHVLEIDPGFVKAAAALGRLQGH